MCRKRLSSPRCRSELIDSAWVVIVPGQKCIKILKKTGKEGIKTRSVTTSEKLDTFASQLEAVFTNEIENSVSDEEVKTDVNSELDQPFAGARLTYQQVIPFDPDIHPDRIRFGEVTDILGKVNTRKACGPDHITNKNHTLIFYLHFISLSRT